MVKQFVGVVVSTKMSKTVVVAVTKVARHPLYKKPMRRTKRFLAHTEGLELAVGDQVRMVETRQISKNKHFTVIEKI